MNKYTIEIDIEEVNNKAHYYASVIELSGWYVQAENLKTLFSKLDSAIEGCLDPTVPFN